MQRWVRIIGAVALALSLTACRIDATVELAVEPNGSGAVTVTVTADADVVAEAPSLPTDLRLADLQASGWQTTGPTPTPEGGLTVQLVRPFASIAEGNQLLEQMSGEDGPFADLVISQRRGFAKVNTRLTGKFRIRRGVSSFADADLLALIGGQLPYETALAEKKLTLDQAFGLRLAVTVPGDAEVTDGLASPSSGTGFDTRTAVGWTADLAGMAATDVGQSIILEAELEDATARRADRFREFAPWALAAWCALFFLVIVPVAMLVRTRNRRVAGR